MSKHEPVTPNRAAEAIEAAKADLPPPPVRDPVGAVLDAIFSDAVGNAVRDIRQKVIEEPWFGRVVTEAPAQVDIWSTLGKDKAASGAPHVEPAWRSAPQPDVLPWESPTPDLEPEL